MNVQAGFTRRDWSSKVSIRGWFLSVMVVMLVLAPRLSLAQDGTSVISGVVRDSSGAAIPGATVKIVNEASSDVIEVVTDGQGSYRASGLAAGQYRVETVLDGFDAAPQPAALVADQIAKI